MRTRALWLFGALVGIAGCGNEGTPAPRVGPVIAAPAGTADSASADSVSFSARNVTEASKAQTADGARPDELPDQASIVQGFVPPFPNRVELFSLPSRKKFIARTDNGDSLIELKGFVTPPDDLETRAVLAIDGIVQPMAVGEEKFGIRVVSIQQPLVTLQRGRSRWTESLE